ncbi:MAG: hypothetical protein II393_01895 [Cytophagales bacterium]|nr:hypothetical protein [Cytophagales bacterium]
MIVRNKIKCLLISLLLLAGVYCSWGCSCCADCYKKCCGKGDNKNENNNNETSEENKEQKDLYFKIKKGTIDDNKLGCFGKKWFQDYNRKRGNNNNNNTILLYELEEQQDVENGADEADRTLVYSKGSKKLQYRNGGDFPNDLKDSKNRWAIFKVTTLNKVKNQEQKGNSHIFYCSDVSTLNNGGLFEEIKCWSIEILAANTQGVKTFYAMFYKTNSSLEQDTKKQNKSGFIGLEKLDVSGAKKLALMFYMALYKQKTVDSLKDWILKNEADISYMFFVQKNTLNFEALNRWIVDGGIVKCEGYLRYLIGSKYNIFFQGEDNSQNNDKLPEWYKNRLQK